MYELVVAEGLNCRCLIPLVSRGRTVGVLMVGRKLGSFATEDVDFLREASGQIAIAIENSLAYGEIVELKEKLAQEKLYLEQEIRSDMNFEQIVGSSPALKRVLLLVETVAPSDMICKNRSPAYEKFTRALTKMQWSISDGKQKI